MSHHGRTRTEYTLATVKLIITVTGCVVKRYRSDPTDIFTSFQFMDQNDPSQATTSSHVKHGDHAAWGNGVTQIVLIHKRIPENCIR